MADASILIAARDVMLAAELVRGFKDLGYDVVATVDRAEAAFRSAEALHPDLVLLDRDLAGRIAGLGRGSPRPSQEATASGGEGFSAHTAGTVSSEQYSEALRNKHAAEAALQESEARYRDLVEVSPDGVIVYVNERVAMANASAAEILRVAGPEDLEGMSIFDIIHPAYHEVVKQRLRDAAEHGKAVDLVEQTYVAANGEPVFVEAAGAPCRWRGQPAALSVFRDISSRKAAEQALIDSEKLLRTIVQTSPAGISLIRDRKVAWLNDSFRTLFGFSSEEDYAGRDTRFLFDNEADYERVGALYDKLADGSVQDTIARWRRKDGSVFEGRLLLKAVDPAAPHEGTVSSLFNVSEIRRAERMASRAERLKAIGELSSGVAHNFNNLLQIVLGGAQLAIAELDSGDIDEARSHLHEIVQSAKLGAQTVRRLQEFARTRSEDAASGTRVFDLADVANQAVEMSKPWWKTQPESQGVSIALDNQCRQRCLVKGNENEIFQVVVNLLKNAAEALPTGGEITIQAFPESRHAHLVVSDTGVGIADTDLSRIFEPFWSTKQFQGTGMGLASSYGIVQAHGGELTAQSQLGQGAVFRVRLPLCAEAEQACPQAEQVSEPGYVERSILLVDDVPAVTKQLQVALGRHGHTVFAASSGEEALRIFRETPIDVVVCDLAMPKMNGWQVGEAIRDICRERGVPRPVFIMLTGWGGQISDPSGMNEAGVDAIVEKPVDSTQLLRIITDAADRPPPG